MTRVTPGARVRAAIVRASSPASAGVVFIFQLAAITIGRIDLIMPEATPSPVPVDRPRPGQRTVAVARRLRLPSPPAARPGRVARPPRRRGGRAARAGRARAAPRTGGGRGARRSRTARPPASRAWPRPPRGPSAAARPAGRPPRARRSRPAGGPTAATDRCRFADSALSTRLSSPRRLRATWRASSSSSDALAPIRPRNVVIDSALFQVTTPWPRRTRHAAGSPTASSRRASSAASSTVTTNSRCAWPPARLSEPRARKRPRSHAVRQCSARPPSRTTRRAGRSPGGPTARVGTRWAWIAAERGIDPSAACPPSRTTRRASAGSRVWTRDPRPAISARRSHGRAASTAASSARSAATRSRSVPDIRLRSTPGSGRPVRAGLARSPAVAALALPRAA